MLQISTDASPRVAVLLGTQKGGGERRRGRSGHICSLCFAALLDLHMSDSPIVRVRGCNAPQDTLRRDTLLAISHAVCHLAGCIYHRESRDDSDSEQSCFSVELRGTWRMERKGNRCPCFFGSDKL